VNTTSLPPADAGPGGPFARWFAPLAYAYIGYGWWQSSIASLSGAAAAQSPVPLWAAGVFAVGARVAGWLLEAGYYVAWWRWRGRVLSFGRFFQWTVALSTVDLLAEAARRSEPTAAWMRAARAWLAGPRPEAGLNVSSWAIAFGGAGLLTLLRLTLVADVQRRALGSRWMAPALLVAATWVASRVVLAWSRDLLTGSSLR